jgi:hypothetical protein
MQDRAENMELTTAHKDAAGKGEAVTVEMDGQIFVRLRKYAYEKAYRILDLSLMRPGEPFQNLDEVWGNDPGLSSYQEYRRR